MAVKSREKSTHLHIFTFLKSVNFKKSVVGSDDFEVTHYSRTNFLWTLSSIDFHVNLRNVNEDNIIQHSSNFTVVSLQTAKSK